MKILLINGPNINMIGIREPSIYGSEDYNTLCLKLKKYCDNLNIDLTIKQSNHEGYLVDWIQEAYFNKYDAVIINPGAYTHTSIALLDATKAISPIPVIEVHLSDIHSREEFRKLSYIGMAVKKQIAGHGFNGYFMAIDYLINL